MQTPFAPPDEIIDEVSMSKEDTKVDDKYMEVAKDLDESQDDDFEVLDDEVPEDEPPQKSMFTNLTGPMFRTRTLQTKQIQPLQGDLEIPMSVAMTSTIDRSH